MLLSNLKNFVQLFVQLFAMKHGIKPDHLKLETTTYNPKKYELTPKNATNALGPSYN